MMSDYAFFATCPKGFEELLATELASIGVSECKLTVGGVYFKGDLVHAYRANLWSRLANKILLPLKTFSCPTSDALYEGVKSIQWGDHLAPQSQFAVDFTGTSREIKNSHFGALRVKDAVVDAFREKGLSRPSIDKQRPDLRINARLHKGKLTLSLDLAHESLHRRGYRQQGGGAPLKENLAAALLLRAQWPQLAMNGGGLLDPMCGSGTFLIEGAMIAADIAPGLLRSECRMSGWLGGDSVAWKQLCAEARERKLAGMAKPLPEIRGYDAAPKAISIANENIERAGLSRLVRVSRRDLAEFKVPTHQAVEPGLVMVNPPYGDRMSDAATLEHLYRKLGERLKVEFKHWHVGLFTSNADLAKHLRMRSYKQYQFYNGAVAARLYLYVVDDRQYQQDVAILALRAGDHQPIRQLADDSASINSAAELSEGAQMFANRLRKNKKKLASWIERENITGYRLYDADMPEYAVAIDIYGDWVHVQEYQAPATVDKTKAERRLQDVIAAIPVVLAFAHEKVVLKQRSKMKGTGQYVKFNDRGEMIEVTEGPCRFLVNLWDYLDTGLFLDHRPVRRMIGSMVKGKTFLNLFCYTGSATVYAALYGAKRTVSVDMSNTYIDWAKRNLAANGFNEDLHKMEVADCFVWLKSCNKRFDLILLDPPTFSNSKKMVGTLDIQRDHVGLIRRSMACLARDGTLIFSNNCRQFSLDVSELPDYTIEDISTKTIDHDYQRNTKIHHCWLIRHKDKE